MSGLNSRDKVFIKSLNVEGKVLGEVMIDHNNGKKGDIVVEYEIANRDVVQKKYGNFDPDDLIFLEKS